MANGRWGQKIHIPKHFVFATEVAPATEIPAGAADGTAPEAREKEKALENQGTDLSLEKGREGERRSCEGAGFLPWCSAAAQDL